MSKRDASLRKFLIAEIDSPLAITIDRQAGIINFDLDNKYPQRSRRLRNSSGRAGQCIDTYGRFIRGGGFQDKIFYKQRVNKLLTNDKLLRKSVDEYSLHKGFAIHVNYNALGQKTTLSHLPFEYCRLSVTKGDDPMIDGIKTHPDWSKESYRPFRQDDIRKYDLYNPDPDVVFKQAMKAGGFNKYRGQIFWYSPLGLKYPFASFHNVMRDVASDAEAQDFRLKNISTNFMASHFVIVDEFESADEERDFIKNLRTFQGSSKASKMMVIQRKKEGQTFKLEKVDIQDIDGLFSTTEQSVKESIRGNYLQPAVLVSDLVSGKLGTAQEIKDATTFYNGITTDDRLIFEETWTELFTNWHIPGVNPSNNFQIDPLKFNFEKPEPTVLPGAIPPAAPAAPAI